MVSAQVDSALLSLAETEAALDLDDPADQIHLRQDRAESGGPSFLRFDKLVQIVDAEGRVLDRSANLGVASLPAPPALLARLRNGEIVMETLPEFAGEPVRVVSLPIEVRGSFRYAIQVVTPLHESLAFLQGGRRILLGGSAAILCAVILTGVVLARGALRPIDRIVARARRMGESNLRERLPDPGARARWDGW